MTPSSSRSDTLDPAARERNDLAEAFARVLLSEGPIAAQAPVFFQEPDGTMIWANDGYYALAALLVSSHRRRSACSIRTWPTRPVTPAPGRWRRAAPPTAAPSRSAPAMPG